MNDVDRFEAFLLEYQDMVFATAVRLLGNAAEAEDIAQTVFLKAFERFDRLDGSASAAGWLKTVATNACLDHLSRHRARWRLFSEIGGGSAGRDAHGATEGYETRLVASGEPLEVVMDEAQEHARLEAAVQALPDHQRVPLVLFHFEQLSYQDIADRLGASLGKVKTDIHRGRLRLKAVLMGRTGL